MLQSSRREFLKPMWPLLSLPAAFLWPPAAAAATDSSGEVPNDQVIIGWSAGGGANCKNCRFFKSGR
jgi:hypothetical protein